MPIDRPPPGKAAEINTARPYVILPDDGMGRFADLDTALSTAQQGHQADPTRTFVVARIIATIEPIITSKLTHHRG